MPDALDETVSPHLSSLGPRPRSVLVHALESALDDKIPETAGRAYDLAFWLDSALSQKPAQAMASSTGVVSRPHYAAVVRKRR